MARYTLIDGYLDTMRSEIRWRGDLDDLVSEMEDHLYSTVETLLEGGVESTTAQRTTLDRFGEPKFLAAVYASTNSGGIAVPTTFTRRAGTFALVSAGFWLISAVAYWRMTAVSDEWQAPYAVFSVSIIIAGVLGLVAMMGVGKRLGGLGTGGMVGMSIVSVGIVASLLAWAVFMWMAVQAVGFIIFGVAALRSGVAPRVATVAVSSGLAIGFIVFVVANVLEVGALDSHGDRPVAWAMGAITGIVILAVGLIGWGKWLRSEEPVTIDESPVAA